MRIASRFQGFGTEGAFEMLAKVKALQAEGRDIVMFNIGEPDFDTPENVKQAAKDALDRNETHYSPTSGIRALREAVAAQSSKLRGVPVSWDEVVIAPGAKPTIFNTIMALVEPGDEVLYPNPGYPVYESTVRLFGGVPVALPLWESRGFAFDPAELAARITPRTRGIILNSPQNPTGGVLSKADLAVVADLAVKHDLWVLSDEIYAAFAFDAPFVSIQSFPGMKERTVVLDGLSKSHAMTGWRLGWAIVPKPLAALFDRILIHTVSGSNTFVQHAALEAVTNAWDAVARMGAEFKRRRDLIVELLNAAPGVRCLKPGGAFYVFPNVTEACRRKGFTSAKQLQDHLLYEAGVGVLARDAFGTINAGETELYIRLSYATSEELIIEGTERIHRALMR